MERETLEKLSGRQFEEFISLLLQKLGFRIEQVQLGADGGIDIMAFREEPLVKGKYIIQCKRQNKPVGQPVVRDLYGTVMDARAAKGILITTSTFSLPAQRFAADKPLELIDGVELWKLLSEAGLPVEETRATLNLMPPLAEAWLRKIEVKFQKVGKRLEHYKNDFIPLPHPRRETLSLTEYVDVVSTEIHRFWVDLRSTITELTHYLLKGAVNGILDDDELDELLSLLLKDLKRLVKLWTKLQAIVPPAKAVSLHDIYSQSIYDFIWWVLQAPERVRNAIASLPEKGKHWKDAAGRDVYILEIGDKKEPYFGKYSAVVESYEDTEQRIQVQVQVEEAFNLDYYQVSINQKMKELRTLMKLEKKGIKRVE